MERLSSSPISVVIATYGDLSWEDLGHERAKPSAMQQNPETLVCVHLEGGTLAEARNLGASDAGGDWLCFLDADDELAPGYLDAMRAKMHEWNLWRREDVRENPLLLSPSVQYVSPTGAESKPQLPNRHQQMTWLNHCVIGTLVPKALFRQVGGFSADYPIYEDWAMFLACVRAGAKIVDVPDAVYRAFERPDSRNQQASSVETYNRIRAEHSAAT